jgi:DNA-binding transcriptional LysR family regulator
VDQPLLRADLNLLKVLKILLEERNVTRTADRMFVSQPAISKSLRRLREEFGDPLFVRTAHGLVPTARAEELGRTIDPVLAQLNNLWDPAEFEPSAASGHVLIGAPEPFLLSAFSDLVLSVRRTAPRLAVESIPLPDDFLEGLAAGSLDFAVYLDQEYGEGYFGQRILSAPPTIWFNERHPLTSKKQIDLADVCAYPFVRFHSPHATREAIAYFEHAILEAGLELKELASTGHLLVALDLLAKSDALMMAPSHLSQVPAFAVGVVSRSIGHIPTFDQKMRITLSLIQHERTRHSPLHHWVAGEIRTAYELASRTEEARSGLA